MFDISISLHCYGHPIKNPIHENETKWGKINDNNHFLNLYFPNKGDPFHKFYTIKHLNNDKNTYIRTDIFVQPLSCGGGSRDILLTDISVINSTLIIVNESIYFHHTYVV